MGSTASGSPTPSTRLNPEAKHQSKAAISAANPSARTYTTSELTAQAYETTRRAMSTSHAVFPSCRIRISDPPTPPCTLMPAPHKVRDAHVVCGYGGLPGGAHKGGHTAKQPGEGGEQHQLADRPRQEHLQCAMGDWEVCGPGAHTSAWQLC